MYRRVGADQFVLAFRPVDHQSEIETREQPGQFPYRGESCYTCKGVAPISFFDRLQFCVCRHQNEVLMAHSLFDGSHVLVSL